MRWENIWINKVEGTRGQSKCVTAQAINRFLVPWLEEVEITVLFVLAKIFEASKWPNKLNKWMIEWINKWINKWEGGPVTTVQCQVAPVNFSAAGLFFLLLHAALQPSTKWTTHNLCGKWLPGNELKPSDQRRFVGGVHSFYVDSSQTKWVFAFWTYSFINVGMQTRQCWQSL